jgi:hypothetical protein
MELTTRKLLTVVTEAALETTLVREIEALGARGYTITDARGKGSHGTREGSWPKNANIRMEVLCGAGIAHAICTVLRERYSDNYSMVIYVADVDVMRPEKF